MATVGRRGVACDPVIPAKLEASSGELNLKLVCVGAANTGKSTFLKYWETKESHLMMRTTINMEFHKQEMDILLPAKDAVLVQPTRDSQGVVDATTMSSFFRSEPSKASSGSLFSAPPQSSNAAVASHEAASNKAGPHYRITAPAIPEYSPCETQRAIVKVWDIQGQESTKSLTRVFYQGAIGALVFCEINSSPETLESAALWKRDINGKVFVTRGDKSEEPVPCWLVVNKYDKLKDMPAPPPWASRPSIDAFAAEHGFVGWSYAAGQRGLNVAETVQGLVAKCIEIFPEEIRRQSGGAGGGSGPMVQRTRRHVKPNQACCNT
jgi:GTPase SAR1 family protein